MASCCPCVSSLFRAVPKYCFALGLSGLSGDFEFGDGGDCPRDFATVPMLDWMRSRLVVGGRGFTVIWSCRRGAERRGSDCT